MSGWAAMLAWVSLVAGLALAFLYSGSETGLYSLNKVRLDLRAESGARSARRLRRLLNNPRGSLTMLLLGNNLTHYLASAGITLLLTQAGVAHPDWQAVAILTPVVFVFCEVLPKNLFHRYAESLTYGVSGFLAFSEGLFTATGLIAAVRAPVWLILKVAGRRLGRREDPLASQRIGAILAEGRASGVLTYAQGLMAQRIVNLSRVRLRDAMVPLDRAVLAPEDVSTEALRELLRRHGHARYGVYAGARDRVIGVVSVYDALTDADGPPAAHMAPALTLPQNLGVSEALVQMQRQRETICFAVDDTGRAVGLATLKDLVEEIVGELDEW